MFLSINILFILKYGLRFLPLPFVLAAVVLYAGFIIVVSGHFRQWSEHVNPKYLWPATIVPLTLLVIVQAAIDPYQLKVDRWSAIHYFLSNLFSGVYPYAAQTHLGGYGSPFPVWQVFHIPFYFLGNVGLSFLVAVCLFVDSIRRIFDTRQAMLAFLLLLFSPAFLYEVMVRSDMLTNFILCSAIIIYFYHFNINIQSHYLLIGITIGLMMSTRLSALIPFAVYFFSDYLKAGCRRQVLLVLMALLIFALSFLPFLLWNGEMLLFFEYNPFVLQSRQGNPTDLLLFIPLGMWLAMAWHGDIRHYAFNTALLLILLVLVTFVHNMYLNDNWTELFQSAYDITYFNMALPFVIFSLIEE